MTRDTAQWELELGITWDTGRPVSPQMDLADVEPTWHPDAGTCETPDPTRLLPSAEAYSAQAETTAEVRRLLALAAKGGPKVPRPWSPPKPFALTRDQRAWAKLYAGLRSAS